QAEDGIRDRTVTGVQTCALPILRVVLSRFPMEIYRGVAGIIGRRLRSFMLAAEALETRPGFEQRAIDGEVFVREQTRRACLCERSEERRVGKEGRARGGVWE